MDDFRALKDIRLTVIGIGLMGGSVLKALKSAENRPAMVTAVDTDPDVLAKIEAKGLADIATEDTASAIKDADMVVIALYPKQAIKLVTEHSGDFKPGCVVTDICGVKREVMDEIPKLLPEGVDFVGGHPMAGREHMGFDYSVPDLFLGCKYILMNGPKKAVKLVRDFADALGAGKIVKADPEYHDEMIAYTSQLPHALAVTYMLSSDARGVEDFSAGSFRDFTRISMINEEMWSELFLENRDKLGDEIDHLMDILNALKVFTKSGDRESLKKMMKMAAMMREGIKG